MYYMPVSSLSYGILPCDLLPVLEALRLLGVLNFLHVLHKAVEGQASHLGRGYWKFRGQVTVQKQRKHQQMYYVAKEPSSNETGPQRTLHSLLLGPPNDH